MVTADSRERVAARLDWASADRLAIFPFRHQVELTATLDAAGLELETVLVAGEDGPVPVSFGFHPYLGLPGLARSRWRLRLPAMRRLVLDERGIPTGAEERFDGFDADLGDHGFDDGFALLGEKAAFSLAGAGRRLTVELLEGYAYAQIYAPAGDEFIALESMTAQTNALASGRGLRLAELGSRFRTAFRVCVESDDTTADMS